MIELRKDEYVVTAFAEPASGPGWANALIKVVIGDRNGELRIEYIQPEDQTAEMHFLYGVSAAAHSAMTKAVESASMRRKGDDNE